LDKLQHHVETRINAASYAAHFSLLRELGNFQGLFRLRKAAFEALKKYFNEKDERIVPQRAMKSSTI